MKSRISGYSRPYCCSVRSRPARGPRSMFKSRSCASPVLDAGAGRFGHHAFHAATSIFRRQGATAVRRISNPTRMRSSFQSRELTLYEMWRQQRWNGPRRSRCLKLARIIDASPLADDGSRFRRSCEDENDPRNMRIFRSQPHRSDNSAGAAHRHPSVLSRAAEGRRHLAHPASRTRHFVHRGIEHCDVRRACGLISKSVRPPRDSRRSFAGHDVSSAVPT